VICITERLRRWLLAPVITLQQELAMNQQELADQLTALGTTVEKIGTETTGLIDAVAALQAALDAAGEVSPEVQAALADVQARVKAVDDLVPDAAPPDA
jgi:hypothetical protein